MLANITSGHYEGGDRELLKINHRGMNRGMNRAMNPDSVSLAGS
jgi:hypothetical protein